MPNPFAPSDARQCTPLQLLEIAEQFTKRHADPNLPSAGVGDETIFPDGAVLVAKFDLGGQLTGYVTVEPHTDRAVNLARRRKIILAHLKQAEKDCDIQEHKILNVGGQDYDRDFEVFASFAKRRAKYRRLLEEHDKLPEVVAEKEAQARWEEHMRQAPLREAQEREQRRQRTLDRLAAVSKAARLEAEAELVK